MLLRRSILPSNPSNQSEEELVDNHVQVLKSVPVNLSLNMEQQETKREQQFSGPAAVTASAPSTVTPGDGGTTAVTVVKAEVYAPVFMAGTGLHYRVDAEDTAARVTYEPTPYEVTSVSHGGYVKDNQQSPPDSPYDEDRDGVRTEGPLTQVALL